SMLAPLLEIKGTPWEREEDGEVSPDWSNYQKYLLDLPLGQYVLRIYQTERNARVDWRGI
ncbi:glutathione S-transferase, partial [Acinetobacter baumannii]